jgi:hypothetical protein
VEVIGSGKYSSLLRYGDNYCCKKFYSTGPRSVKILFGIGINGLQTSVAVWVQDVSCDFYLVKDHKTVDKSTTTNK